MRPPALSATAALLALLAAPAALAAPAELVEFERSAEALVLRFEQRQLKLANAPRLLLEVFGDGRVVVERPSPLRPAGRFELRLAPGELEALLARVASRGLVEFDPARVAEEQRERRRASLREARAGRAPLWTSSAEDRVRLELNLSRWREEGDSGDPRRNVRVDVSFRNLHQAARELPEAESVQGLAGAVEALDELLARPALRGEGP